ncbi:GDSL esterase/lipase-like [Dorcoceras hygrometricum]|uniref:GDSL esterase/lipase-like n=1 Tax=Dorcoceras hygrometricum TaxID=472368 RepID=A0A2Z7B5F1_9LAMI|nr:GDSL esterase/lipase-like [Dorcoceras hygrometricum]
MGWEATLPYLSPELRGQKLLVGANFASAGVGVLNDTGIQFVNIIRIHEQLSYFEQYQRRRLHQLGARRVLVTGTGPLGCVPAELAQHSRSGECAQELQHAASLFNPQLKKMLSQLNEEIGSNVFIAANTNQMHMNFISNPQNFGMSFE